MADHEDRNVVAAYTAARRRQVQFWAVVLFAAVLGAGAVYLVGYDRPAQTTTSDGRNVESPATATGGSAR